MQQKQVVRFILLLVAIFVVLYLTYQSWWYIREHSFDKEIRVVAMKYGVDPALVKAVVWRESKFRHLTVGAAGEVGLMQVTLPAAKDWADAFKRPPPARQELFKVGTNLEAGTWYLSRALKRWRATDNPVPFALAEYNAGPSNARKWAGTLNSPRKSREFIANIGIASTRRYVQDVMALQEKLNRRGRL